jgi:hypothetical protein
MDRQYVGIDFHRRRSVVVRMSATGEKLSSVRILNDPVAIAAAVAEAGVDPEVVVEATYGWYWVVDLLQAIGARVHLANPQGSPEPPRIPGRFSAASSDASPTSSTANSSPTLHTRQGGPGRASRDDSAIQRDRPNPNNRLFGKPQPGPAIKATSTPQRLAGCQRGATLCPRTCC